ncbi:flagellar motor switch protein FliM [Rhodospirillaceae bacterium SYSU D60014]|uniref:flagellar motor switch protein FliM n=1 Tax=Virgifigura deserti TaxID=2268457 RepID=UPI000E662E7D
MTLDTVMERPDGETPPPRRDVLAQLTNSAALTQERLPMLNVVMDRLVRLLTTSIRQLTSRNVRIMVEAHEVRRFGDALADVAPHSMIAVVNSREWDNKFLITADAPMVYSCVDILLGGKQRGARLEEERSFTPIERRLSERLLRLVMQNLEKAFSPITEVEFSLERMETNAEFAAICRESNATISVALQVNFERVSGRITILLPYATIEPIRKLLLQMFMGEKFGRDPVWETHLKGEIKRTEMKVVGVLHEKLIPLSEVSKWRVGMTIPLNATTKTPARLVCNNKTLLRGEVGQSNGSIAIKVDTVASEKQEFLNDLVSN